MGDFNQYTWICNNIEKIRGPVLEVGSRHYNDFTSNDFRSLCSNYEYIGLDISEGKNVDMVLDFTLNISAIQKKFGNKKFKTIICCSVLEHVKDIFAFSQNIELMLEKDGMLFISVPFTWEYHGYPSDYWRFTPEGIKYLFSNLDFAEGHTISSHLKGDMMNLSKNVNDFSYITLTDIPILFSNNFSPIMNFKRAMKFLIKRDFRRKLMIYKWLKTNRLLKVCTINMIGIKK